MICEKELIERIGYTKLDKIELADGEIIEINDMQSLIDKEILVNNSTMSKYTCHSGQEFSYLKLKKDDEIHGLKCGCTGYGKQYAILQTGVTDADYGNVIGNSVDEYKRQIERIELKLEQDYGIVASFRDARIKYIEVNRTFVTEHEFEKYNRVIELILNEMPWMNTVSMFGKTKNEQIEIHTYSAWNRRKATAKSKQYKQITFYDKASQMQGLIEFTGQYMRFEIKLKGVDNIRNAFGTCKIYELTQEKVDEYFRTQVKELIEKPLDRWKYDRDKFILKLMKNQYKQSVNSWQVNTLRVLINKELEQGVPCLLDVQELFDIVDQLPLQKKNRIKNNLLHQAEKYERVFCNGDSWKLKEILDKLLF